METEEPGRVLDMLAICLRNIALGYWNTGRRSEQWVSVNEYARQALVAAGLWDRDGD